MEMRSGGQILVDGLIEQGVSHVFCVPGESYLCVLDALYDRQEEIQIITCRQEGGASYMAEAVGKLTGRPGICFASRGPGASNAMIGIHTAFQDSTPLLLFIGQVPRSCTGREAFQELDYREVYQGVAKAVIRISDAARIPEQLGTAWNCSMQGRPGPVVVELPEDMLSDQACTETRPPGKIDSPVPDTEAVQDFAAMLEAARRPVLLSGGAGWNPEATTALTRFSEKHQVPVCTAFRRSDCFDNTHPHYIGELGLGPDPKLVERVQQSDLLIAVACRLGDMTTSNYRSLMPPDRTNCHPDQQLVHVYADAGEIGRVFRPDLGIASSPRAFLEAAASLPPCHRDRSPFIAEAHQAYLAWIHMERNAESALRTDRIMDFLRNRLPENAILTVGAGNYSIWPQRNYRFRHFRTFLGSTNGSMGYGVPSAISAKLVRPDAMVVSFSGDGCFLMNGQELATAKKYGLNIIFLVFNNSRYGTIRKHQEAHFPGRVSGTELSNPDFVALGRAYGAHAERVTRTDQFERAFENAVAAGLPAVIEITIDY